MGRFLQQLEKGKIRAIKHGLTQVNVENAEASVPEDVSLTELAFNPILYMTKLCDSM